MSSKPDATQVEPEVLAALKSAEVKAAADGEPIDEKSETISENLGNPDTTPNASLRGRVVNTAGRSVPGASVVLMDTDGNLLAQALTDAAGRYIVTSLQAGPYVVQVVPTAGQSGSWARTWYPADANFMRADVVSVTDQTPAVANITVQPGARLQLKVTSQRKALPGATVQVCAESYLDCQITTSSAKGAVALQGLPISPVRIAVTTSNGSRYEFTTTITTPGVTRLALDTVDGNLVAKGKS